MCWERRGPWKGSVMCSCLMMSCVVSVLGSPMVFSATFRAALRISSELGRFWVFGVRVTVVL